MDGKIHRNIKIGNFELINFVNLTDEEVALTRNMRNHDSIRRWMYNDHVISKEEHLSFLKSLKETFNKVYWLVKSGHGYIGVINFLNIMWNHRNAYLGIYANPYEKKRGNGKILLGLIVDIAFGYLNLHSLRLEVIEDNKAAIGLYKKFGFEEEGRLREFVFKEGKWKDVIVMGMINPSEKQGQVYDRIK